MFRPRAALALAVLLCSCVGPVFSFGDFEAKAADTADSAASAIATARLAVTAAAEGRAFSPYLSVVLTEAERDLRSTRQTFVSIQPPDQASADLRTQLLDLLDRSEAVLSDLRIAARWQDFGSLRQVASPLSSLDDELTAFSEAHQ
jgi:hypothetical protein